jgi:hypothetical protein
MKNEVVSEAVKVCSEAVRAIDALRASERFTPFAGWYRGDHAKARTAVRRAVEAVEAIASSEEEKELCRLFLAALRKKAPLPGELRAALVREV